MRFINAETVYRCINDIDLINGLHQLHQMGGGELKDLLLSESRHGTSENFLFVRAAFTPKQAIGVKIATVFPANKQLPSVQGIFILFDVDNGTPIGIIDGTALTHRKTAADSALGSRLLSRENSQSLLMVGAGSMAPHLIRAHCAVRPSIKKIVLYNRTQSRAEKLAQSLGSELPKSSVTDNLEEAVRNAHIICCATLSKEPIILGDWLQAGSHLDLVGAYRLDMREADDACLQKGQLFVDSRKTTIGEIGEIEIPRQAGIITDKSILGDLYDLCNSPIPWQRKNNHITIYKNGGGGHLDLMTAQLIFKQISDNKQA